MTDRIEIHRLRVGYESADHVRTPNIVVLHKDLVHILQAYDTMLAGLQKMLRRAGHQSDIDAIEDILDEIGAIG